ncbi:MAG: hypothetical protein AAGL49_02405 [Pseudomonadota bacterium]
MCGLATQSALDAPKTDRFTSSMRLAAYQPDIAANVGGLIRLSACFASPLDVIAPCGFPMSDKELKRTALDYEGIAQVRLNDR